MSENKHSGKAKNQSKKSVTKQSALNNDPNNDPNNENNSNPKTEHHNHPQSPPHEITINMPKADDNWTKYNITAVVAMAVNFLILCGSGYIALQGRKTATIADSTYHKVVDQFNKSNEPFLQAIKPAYDTAHFSQRLFHITISNLGKYPVKILAFDMGYTIRSAQPADTEAYAPNDSVNNPINQYISYETPLELYRYFYPLPTENDSTFIRRRLYLIAGVWSIFLSGRIKYLNLVLKDTGYYTFMIRFNPYKNFMQYLRNDNGEKITEN